MLPLPFARLAFFRLPVLLGFALLVSGCRRTPSGGPVNRIVSLSPSLTQMAFALGIGHRIVGVTKYDEKPDSVRHLPRVGGFLDVDVEAVAQLNPDLVLVSELHARLAGQLRSLGIETLELRTRSISEVFESIQKLGKRTGTTAQAGILLQQLQKELAPVSCVSGTRRVLVTLGRSPDSLTHLVAAGPGTYLDELVRLCGARNVLSDGPAAYPAMSMERLVESAPDVIVDLSPDGRPAPWNTVPFARMPRIHTISDPGFSTPGVELGRVKRELCQKLCAP